MQSIALCRVCGEITKGLLQKYAVKSRKILPLRACMAHTASILLCL